MGMELRISEIRNDKAKRAAYEIDNGDGVLKQEELQLFQDKARQLGVSDRAINQVMDSFHKQAEVAETTEDTKTRKDIRAERYATAKEEVQTIASGIKGEEGRYTHDVLAATKAQMQEDGKLNRQERQALRDFRKTAVATDAQEVILDAIIAQDNEEIEGTTGNTQTMSGQDVVTNEDLTKKRIVKQAAKKDLKTNGNWNDTAVRQEWRDGNGRQFFTGQSSFVDSAARIQAAQNDAEQSVVQTTQEVMTELNTDNKMDLLSSLNGKTVAKRDVTGKPIEGETLQVAYKDADGNWHFDGLSQEIENIIGADLELNRDARKDRLVAEFTKVHGKLNQLTGKQLSKNEVRELVRLCGFDIEEKDWRKIVAGALTGGAIGAGTGALAAGGDKSILLGDEVINLKDHIQIPEILDVTNDIKITIPGEVIIIPASIGTAAALGLIIPAVIGALNGLKDAGQIPVVPQNFSATTPEALVEELKSEGNPYAAIFGLLAAAFRKEDADGNMVWDREGFKDFLNSIAGDGNGLLNKEELIGALMKVQRGEVEPPAEEPEEVCAVEITEETPNEEKTEDITYIHHRKGGDSWAGIVTAYYPALVEQYGLWGKDGAIKRLQKALACDENGTYNAETFRAIITATDLPKEMKLPSQIEGHTRVDGTVVAENIKGSGQYKAALDTVGNNEYKILQVPGTTTYTARDLCNNSTASGSSRDEAFRNLQKQNPGKNYKVNE